MLALSFPSSAPCPTHNTLAVPPPKPPIRATEPTLVAPPPKFPCSRVAWPPADSGRSPVSAPLTEAEREGLGGQHPRPLCSLVLHSAPGACGGDSALLPKDTGTLGGRHPRFLGEGPPGPMEGASFSSCLTPVVFVTEDTIGFQ